MPGLPVRVPNRAAHAVDIVAGQVQRVDTCLRPVRRGDQRSAAVTARSIGPLGMAGRQRSRPVPGQVRVLPPFLSRKHLPSRLARLREIDGLLPTLTRGQGTEFDSLREYVVGDDVRSIDWRATARRADVVVRTWRPERDRRVVIVLDTGRTAAGRVGVDPTASDPGGWPRLDWSMDAALLLAALASRAGDHVDFLAHDRVSRAGVFGASRTELLAQLGRRDGAAETGAHRIRCHGNGFRYRSPDAAASAGRADDRPQRERPRRGPVAGTAPAVGQAPRDHRRGHRPTRRPTGRRAFRCGRGVRRGGRRTIPKRPVGDRLAATPQRSGGDRCAARRARARTWRTAIWQ